MQFHGMVTLSEAFARSYNVAAVRLGIAVGIEAVAARAASMGITSRLPVVNSLPLGSCMINPLEMARAYIPFATGGLARNTTAIVRVEDRYGNLLESNEQPDPRQTGHEPHRSIPDEQPASIRVQVGNGLTLQDGTGTARSQAGRPGGKTGTDK